jgi:predicted nuclease of predicted toxin-antitoxin system
LIRFQADADLRNGIVKAVRLREPSIDFASAAEGELHGLADPEVLELAANAGRILVTHDRRTMIDHFRTRLAEGKSSPGVFLITQSVSMGQIVEAIVMVWAASEPQDWENQVRYLPSMSRHYYTR